MTLTGTATGAPARDPASPPTPTPVATAFDPAQRAAGLLGTKNPFAVGAAGNLRLSRVAATKLGKPKASMLLAAAVCTGGECAGKATANSRSRRARAASAPTPSTSSRGQA